MFSEEKIHTVYFLNLGIFLFLNWALQRRPIQSRNGHNHRALLIENAISPFHYCCFAYNQTECVWILQVITVCKMSLTRSYAQSSKNLAALLNTNANYQRIWIPDLCNIPYLEEQEFPGCLLLNYTAFIPIEIT